MSTDPLSDRQFRKYKYKPAAEEGKAASEWLSTQEGHDWITGSFAPRAHGFYGFKSIVPDPDITNFFRQYGGGTADSASSTDIDPTVVNIRGVQPG